MQVERVPIDSITEDPANVRVHGDRNMEAIRGSLRKFGQQKPIVVSEAGVVIAGNGTLRAARDLGWTEIDVVRSNLEGVAAVAFAIADNRTAELAEWHVESLRTQLGEIDLDLGFLDFPEIMAFGKEHGVVPPDTNAGWSLSFTLTLTNPERQEELEQALAEIRGKFDGDVR